MLSAVLSNTDVIKAQINRVAEPAAPDFVLMTPLRQERLATNETNYYDNILTGAIEPETFEAVGSIARSILTVTELVSGAIIIGSAISGANIPSNAMVLSQISGDAGGVGVYAVNVTPNLSIASTAIAGAYGQLTVSEISRAASPLVPGMTLIDTNWPTMELATDTIITGQQSGSTGDVGIYTVLPSQTVAQETMYADVRADMVPTRMVVQLDVHGPNSGNNVKIIDALFRSEVGTAEFADTGLAVQSLYCDDARQIAFVNDQQQYEDRWVMEAHLQFNPIVGTPQQFADQVDVTVVDATSLPTS